MSKRYSTAGMQLCYAVETTAGTRPTSFTALPEIKNMPATSGPRDAIDVTPLDETDMHQYASGLRSGDGALAFGANMTDDFLTAVSTMVTAYEAGAASGKATWFAIVHPGLAKACFFTGEPDDIAGFDDAAVGDPANATLYIIRTSAAVMDTKPTVA